MRTTDRPIWPWIILVLLISLSLLVWLLLEIFREGETDYVNLATVLR